MISTATKEYALVFYSPRCVDLAFGQVIMFELFLRVVTSQSLNHSSDRSSLKARNTTGRALWSKVIAQDG